MYEMDRETKVVLFLEKERSSTMSRHGIQRPRENKRRVCFCTLGLEAVQEVHPEMRSFAVSGYS